MELAAMQQVGGRSPQHDGGEGLVGKSEVTPQHPKGNEVQSDAHDKQRDGYHQAVLVRALIIADGVGNGQTGSTEGRIAGCHGQHHNAEDGKGATEHAKQFHGDVVHDQRGVRHSDILSAVQTYDPVFAEVLPLTLEEIFISETEAAGYDIKDFLY